VTEQGTKYATMFGVPQDEAEETVKAKLVGRWSNGIPLMAAPTYAEMQKFSDELAAAKAADDKATLARLALKYVDFTYRPDPAGAACPITSHLRRANPRDNLDPYFGSPDAKAGDGSALVNRRRILRRGLPYGASDPGKPSDDNEQGIIFLAICTSLFRQFEFVQQQWMQYGLDFNAGSDTCPIVGNHPPDHDPKLVVAADPRDPAARPFICADLPQLVEPRGGDYFFIPSMTCLRMIGMGIVDPT
jgi:deferrochelatase/peroxidase EfeB